MNRWFAPVDIASLVYFRVAFGLLMLWHAAWDLQSGFVRATYIEPKLLFPYDFFEWVRPWPGDGMIWHFVAMGALGLCVALGLFYRLCALLLALVLTSVFLLEQAQYQNHYYLISLVSVLMVCVPAHRACSLDARRRPALHSDTAPAWALWLIRFQIAVPYFYGAIAKLNHDWLHAQPMAWRLSASGDFPVLGPFFSGAARLWLAYAYSYGGLLFDLLVVPFLLWRRTRVLAYLAALGFHLSNWVMFDIGIFPPFMILATAMFFEPDWPRRLVRRWRRWGPEPSAPTTRPEPPTRAPSGTLGSGQRVALALLCIYVALQLLLPFRHVFYPGNRFWTKEAFRFAWSMKMSHMRTRIRFFATDPMAGTTREIDPLDHLTPWQSAQLSTQPQMIRRLSRTLADELRAEGWADARVRVQALASLNGRRPQALIDPEVDLAMQAPGLAPDPWIRPLLVPLAERIQPGDFQILRDPRAVERNAWAGFAPGSWVAYEDSWFAGTSRERRRVRRVLDSEEDGRLWTTTVSERDGTVEDTERTLIPLGMLPEELARPGFERNSRSISIDGRRLRVEVHTHRIDDSEAQRVGMLKVWRSAEIEIPYRELPIPGARLALLPDVARARLRLTLADSEILYEARVESLGESCNVAGRRVRCTEERVTLATTRAGSNETVELRRWLSAVVPGHLVREERGSSEPDGTVWPRSSRAALAFEAHRSGAAPR